MINIFGIIVLNAIYICYNTYKNTQKDEEIKELKSKIDSLEHELLKRNDFIANELHKEYNENNENNQNNEN